MSEWLTVGEAAQIVGVSPGTLRRWDRSGKLSAIRHPVSGFRMYLRDRLDALIPTEAPPPTPSLLGRQREAEALRGLTRAHRLVLVSGPPGIGKTRLLQAHGPAGVPIDASEVVEPDGLRRGVARALGVGVGAVEDRLGTHGTTLALDHLDRGIDAGVPLLLVGWLRDCPTLRIVATSRQALRVPNEVVLSLGPLSVAAGVQLFQRRGTNGIGWDQDAIAALVERLEGNPLAIELAAAASSLVGPEQLHALPQDNSLQGAVQGSLDRLADRDRAGLEALLVFRGGFTATAACAVLGEQGLDILHGLKAASLLRSWSAGGAVRHAPWVVVREVMLGQACGDSDAAIRHATWLRRRLSEHPDDVDAELDNYRAVLASPLVPGLLRAQVLAASWSAVIQLGPVERVEQVRAVLPFADPALAARLHDIRGSALLDLGRLPEALRDFDAGLALAAPDDTRSSLYLDRALIRMRLDQDEALDDVARALELAEAFGSDRLLARALMVQANAALARGERTRAMADLRTAVQRARRHGNADLELSGAVVLCRLEVSAGIGRLEDALRCVALAQELGQANIQGYAQETLATLLLDQGKVQPAIDTLVAARDGCRQRGYDEQAAKAGVALAVALLVGGRPAEAEGQARIATEALSPVMQQRCVALRAMAAHRAGDRERARRLAETLEEDDNGLISIAHALVRGIPIPEDHAEDALARSLARTLSRPGGDALQVAADGTWFQAPGQEPVQLAHRPVLAAMLRALAAASGPLAAHDLAAITWPEAQWVGDSGVRRVRSAIWALRRLGLADALRTRAEGYELGYELGSGIHI